LRRRGNSGPKAHGKRYPQVGGKDRLTLFLMGVLYVSHRYCLFGSHEDIRSFSSSFSFFRPSGHQPTTLASASVNFLWAEKH
jgi:hypothetical protein